MSGTLQGGACARVSGILALVSVLGCADNPAEGTTDGAAGKGDAAPTYDAASLGGDDATRTDAANGTWPDDATLDADALAEPDSIVQADSMVQPDSSEADAGPPAIRYLGRFDMSDPSRPTAEWSASAMQARFSGTSVSVSLGGSGSYFEVVVDGVVRPVLKTTGASSDLLASGLDAGTHDVLVFRRDEAFDGPAQFLGFDFGAGGQLLPPPPAPAHRIEVIGDSISAGFCDETASTHDPFTAATENEYLAYGPVTARSLGADIHVVAWSGKGMYRNLDGTTTETVPVLWERTIPTDKTSHWDPSRWVADAVVINLGTNDYNAKGADPTSEYQATYLQFVTQLRGVYPGAFFFCAVGPMLGGTRYASAKAAITSVISTRKAAGDARLQLVEFPTLSCAQDGSGCGCAGHPTVAQHQTMAGILEAAVRTSLGW
jgi:lysophospholipase L1-like esterase